MTVVLLLTVGDVEYSETSLIQSWHLFSTKFICTFVKISHITFTRLVLRSRHSVTLVFFRTSKISKQLFTELQLSIGVSELYEAEQDSWKH